MDDRIRKLDRGNMLEKIISMPEHFAEAWASNDDVAIDIDTSKIKNITVSGMGGSAISGDVLRCLMLETAEVPIFVNRDYRLPAFIDKNSLVIVSSYSGNTEESLSTFEEAKERDAHIICITSGGALAEQAQQFKYPVFVLPEGFPPRAALVFLVVPLLKIAQYLGLLENIKSQIDESIELLTNLREKYDPEGDPNYNISRILAEQAHGKAPIVYACSGLLEVAATRWRGQFSENAEVLAYSNLFPEMNHNEIVGWGLLSDLDGALQVIYLRDKHDHHRSKLRMDLVKEIIEETSNPILELWSQGESALARLFSIIFTGDLASYYAALLNNVDPTPVEVIDYLKKSMKN